MMADISAIDRTFWRFWRLFRYSLASLPYLYYVSFLGLFANIVYLLVRFRKTALDPLTRNGLLLISGMMLLNCAFAVNRGEALLQLSNFLPFFLFFSVLPFLMRRVEHLERLAIDLVIATIPINLLALVQYLCKADFVSRKLRRNPIVHWFRDTPHAGRAILMFNHPNALANYLVLILGLGLGLILCYSMRPRRDSIPERLLPWLYVGTFINLLGIFCAGSRNGLIVAISQLLMFSFCTKINRRMLLLGLLGLLGLLVGSALFGIGGRSLLLNTWADDPRVGVWEFALKLIQERPLLGWGLGNFKLQFHPGIVPGYEYIGHPHNFWLLLASEGGIPLMLVFTALVGYLCYRAVRVLLSQKLQPWQNGILLGYLLAFWGCITFALFDVTLFDVRLNAIDWVILAGIYAIAQIAGAKPDLPS